MICVMFLFCATDVLSWYWTQPKGYSPAFKSVIYSPAQDVNKKKEKIKKKKKKTWKVTAMSRHMYNKLKHHTHSGDKSAIEIW